MSLAPWAESVHSIISWLESKRVSPPFHKSRLLLILKDVLCGRQPATLLLFAHQSREHHELNFEWFRLVARMSQDPNYGSREHNELETSARQEGGLSTTQAATVSLQVGGHQSSSQFSRSSLSSTPAAGVAARGATRKAQSTAPPTNDFNELSFLDTPMAPTNNSNNNRAKSVGSAGSIKRSNSNNDVANMHLQGHNNGYATSASNVSKSLSTPTHISRPIHAGSSHQSRVAEYNHIQQQFTQQQQQQRNITPPPASNESEKEYMDDFSHREVCLPPELLYLKSLTQSICSPDVRRKPRCRWLWRRRATRRRR